jgi:hypothetical protein
MKKAGALLLGYKRAPGLVVMVSALKESGRAVQEAGYGLPRMPLL